MNNHIIVGVIGFIVGGLAGGFFMGCWQGKQYKKQIDRLQYEVDDLTDKLHEKKAADISERTKKVEKNKFNRMTMQEIVDKAGYSRPEPRKDDRDEDDEFDSEEDIEFQDPFVEEESEESGGDDGEEPGIRLIDKKLYDEDLNFRDSETLTFYQEDGVLADQFDDPVARAVDVIGIEAIEEAEKTDKDVIYVSNDIEDKIYEIMVEHNESFYRDI